MGTDDGVRRDWAMAVEWREAGRALLNSPAFAVAAVFSLATAIALALSFAAVFDLATVSPPVVRAQLALDRIENPALVPWSAQAQPAAVVQAGALKASLLLIVGLGLAAALVAGLNLWVLSAARAFARRHETAVRMAVGATPGRLRLQALAEVAWIAVWGAVLGALVGSALAAWIERSWPHGRAGAGGSLDPWLAIAALAVPIVATVILFLLQASRESRRRRRRAPAVTPPSPSGVGVTVLQFATLVVLLTAAAALWQGGREPAGSRPVGFDPRDTLTLTARLAGTAYAAPAERVAAQRQIQRAIRSTEGVLAVGLTSPGTWLGFGTVDRVLVECGRCFLSQAYLPIQPAYVRHHAVSPGFFAALGLPVVGGREFDEGDAAGAARVALVSVSFARRSFEGGDSIGKRVQVGGLRGPWYEVVGVVGDLDARGLGSADEPASALYLSALQHPPEIFQVAVRAADLDATAPALTHVVRVAAPGVEVREVATLAGALEGAQAPVRWFGRLSAFLALCVVLSAAYGLYAVVSSQVARRRPEIGLRRAVGARGLRIAALFLGEALRISAFGAALGLWAAVGVSGTLQRFLDGVPLFDPVRSAAIVGLLAAVALAAALVPAIRAAQLDPVAALRAE